MIKTSNMMIDVKRKELSIKSANFAKNEAANKGDASKAAAVGKGSDENKKNK